MSELLTAESLIAFLTLTSLEIVLGIDNIVFISILTGKLPEAERPKARTIGLAAAMGSRIALLFAIGWVVKLTEPLFEVAGYDISGRDMILLLGGLFLIGKATHEIHNKLEGPEGHVPGEAKATGFRNVIIQIAIIDMVFSLDSVITAVGMVKHIEIMIAAVMVSVGIMLAFAGKISAFIEHHPTLKVLALSFLLMIGVMLVMEGLGQHIEKGYVYFAMAFSLGVEIVNIRVKIANERKAGAEI